LYTETKQHTIFGVGGDGNQLKKAEQSGQTCQARQENDCFTKFAVIFQRHALILSEMFIFFGLSGVIYLVFGGIVTGGNPDGQIFDYILLEHFPICKEKY
jgi:hypothetical protein